MNKLIDKLGENFRGLLRSNIVTNCGIEQRWSVTFNYKGDLVETDYRKTPIEALKTAINILNMK